MDITEKQIWQTIPIIGASFSILVLITNIIVHTTNKAHPENFISTAGVLILLGLTTITFVYLIFFPTHVSWYPILCVVHGLLNIIESGSVIGFMMCTLGCAFALRFGFFRHYAKVKFFGIVLLLTTAVLLQLRFGLPLFFKTLMNIGVMLIMFIMFWFLFRSYLSELLPKQTSVTELDLGQYNLQPRDYDFIRQILNDKKYDAIASSHLISESAVKQRMSVIYKRLGVANRTEFLLLASNSKFIFPDEGKHWQQ